MKRLFILLLFFTFSCLSNATYWDDDETHDVDYIVDSYLQIGGSATVNVYQNGGSESWIGAMQHSKLNIFNGTFGGSLAVRDDAVAVVHSGEFNSSTDKPSYFGLVVGERTVTDIYGGNFQNNGVIRIYGGSDDRPELNFYGSNFQIGNQSLFAFDNFEELVIFGAMTKSIDGEGREFYSGLLTGTLEDSSLLNNTIEFHCLTGSMCYINSDSTSLSLTVIPEPMTVLLMGFGVLLIRRNKLFRV